MKLPAPNAKQRPANTGNKSVHSPRVLRCSRFRAFTLIEMILVMALLVIAVSFVAPSLSGFFRGRALKSEANQIISLMHQGQSRAVSGGVPMVLWFDTTQQKYGLEEEPGYVDKDPNAVEFTLGDNLKIEIPDNGQSANTSTDSNRDTGRAGMPQINFLPDGTISETSPQTINIVDHDADKTLSLTQTRDRNEYDIATPTEQ